MTIRGLKEERFPERLQIKVELRETSTLQALGRQARTHSTAQIKQIARSISTFGFISPIMIDQLDNVLVGMGRLAAARLIGLKLVPTLVVDHLTPEEKRLYVIADNQLALKAGWDVEILGLELAELQELDFGLELEITGFELPEIEAAIHGQHRIEEDDDELPLLPVKPVSRPGDFWNLGPHRVGCDNSLEDGSYERLMSGTPLARLANLDFPYNVPTHGHITSSSRHADFEMAAGEMSPEQFAGFLRQGLVTPQPYLMPGALLVTWMDWRSADVLIGAGREAGLELMNLLVWDKGRHAGQGSFWRSQHELAPVFRKPGAEHLNNVQLGKNGRNRGNVLRYDGVNGFGAQKAREREMHPTCKSVSMTRDLIIDCTQRGDVIIDGFSGSGTSLIAAERTGRVARVMDISPVYVDVAIRRWEALTGGRAVHADTGRTLVQTGHDRDQEGAAPPVQPPPARIRVRRRPGGEG